ncbi:MAG TPA: hypothetical protein GX511_05685, partial [Firmicutes bacterium]|nr:hypothetical protein [Bacillota bacterium]
MAHGYLEKFNLLKGEELLAVCGLFTDKVEGGAGPEFFLDLTRLPEPEKAITELRELLVPSLGEHLWASLATSKFVARAATLAQRAGQVRGTGG